MAKQNPHLAPRLQEDGVAAAHDLGAPGDLLPAPGGRRRGRSVPHQVLLDDRRGRARRRARGSSAPWRGHRRSGSEFRRARPIFDGSTQYSMMKAFGTLARKCRDAATLMSVVKLWLMTGSPALLVASAAICIA